MKLIPGYRLLPAFINSYDYKNNQQIGNNLYATFY